MTHDKNTTPTSHNLQNLNIALADTMLVNGYDPAILASQVEILDRLFAAILDEQVAPKLTYSGGYPENIHAWLKLALQCQKQCNDTVKSRAAMEYMQTLGANIPPPPIKTIKQNGEV